jgi:carboxyl-terminal processing protease
MAARAKTLLFGAACLAAGVVLGAQLRPALASTATPPPAPASHSRYAKLDMFARALSIIEQHYVRPVDGEQLVYAAIRGLVSELDPHSNFLVPAEARLLREDIEGVFGGVGMVVVLGRDPDGTRFLDVRDVIPDGPADDAGIVTGNRIVKVDGRSIAQFPDLQRAITTIRGEPGTSIKVTVEDRGRGIVRSVTLVREVIDPPAVEIRVLGEGIASLRLREFSDAAAREVHDAIARLRRELGTGEGDKSGKGGLRGLVLDLRDNGGGLLDEAVGIVDLFVDEGVIVRTRGRRGTLLDEARAAGHQIGPGSLGENILTAGIDLLGLPTDTRLHLGEAVLRVTGLRNPCRQINDLSPDLLKICVERADGVATDSDVDLGPTGGTVSRDGQPIRRKAGIMAVVERGGQVVPGDVITVELPDGHVPLEPV